MTTLLPPLIEAALLRADPSWHQILRLALLALAAQEPDYLPDLAQDTFLPTDGRLFAAFSQPLQRVRYVLVGEGPYPRAQSATGVCFMDGAVGSLWSQEVGGGLSKQVNRATSLRNFIKMLLVAAGQLTAQATTGAALAGVAQRAHNDPAVTQTLAHLQQNLEDQGFLLLNASLVFRPHVAPAKEARPWQVFFVQILQALLTHAQEQQQTPPCLVLWGKIAAQLQQIAVVQALPQLQAEHPYNLSFIQNPHMQALFAPMDLLGFAKSRHAPTSSS